MCDDESICKSAVRVARSDLPEAGGQERRWGEGPQHQPYTMSLSSGSGTSE